MVVKRTIMVTTPVWLGKKIHFVFDICSTTLAQVSQVFQAGTFCLEFRVCAASKHAVHVNSLWRLCNKG